MLRRLLAVCVFTVLVTAAHAEVKATTTVYGPAAYTCSKWLSIRQSYGSQMDKISLSSWVGGYFSAINSYVASAQKNVAKGANLYDMESWVDGYCKTHPEELVFNAVENLSEFLLGGGKITPSK